MTLTMEQEVRPAADIEQKIRALDARLDDLRTRRKRSETELDRLSKEESRLVRIFAQASGKEKTEIRGRVDAIARERSDRERDMQGLAVAIAEAEQERNSLLPEYEREWKLRSAQERKKKLDQLWQEHDRNLIRVRDCDQALQDARATADRSFFAWTSFRDQQALDEQLAAREALKTEWAKRSGPNAPGNRR